MFREEYIKELIVLEIQRTETSVRKWCTDKTDSQIQEAIDILKYDGEGHVPQALKTCGTFYTV